ncbi:MAG: hypothetical protein R6V26_15265, partial [Roseovarius sp.]
EISADLSLLKILISKYGKKTAFDLIDFNEAYFGIYEMYVKITTKETKRNHPDYRAEVCFDNATRANLGGLKHSERVFLGLCLLHRYANKRGNTRFSDLSSLLSERDCHDAEVVGKAMRFAAMLWLKKDARLGELRWHPRKKVLELHLSKEAAPLFGEVAQARFKALADALGAEAVVH